MMSYRVLLEVGKMVPLVAAQHAGEHERRCAAAKHGAKLRNEICTACTLSRLIMAVRTRFVCGLGEMKAAFAARAARRSPTTDVSEPSLLAAMFDLVNP